MTVESVDLSPEKDGGVLKTILTPGNGDAHPSKGDTVHVHYDGTLEDGTKFDSSRDRGEEFTFTLGRGQVIKAWDLGVANMKRGEVADLICKPAFAYGEAGSPPKIPPNATLKFRVELLGWEGEDISPDKDKTITRSIQKEGEKWDSPNEGSQVHCHVIGYRDGRQFLADDFRFELGECTEVGLPSGVDKALKRMRKGERSLVHLGAPWGYGKAGGRPEAQIPPNAELDLDIELKDFEKAPESWKMNDEEKLAEAGKLKQRGTEFFSAGKLHLAIEKYKRIVDLLQFEEKTNERRNALYRAAHSNLALCYLKMDDTAEALKHCEKVLEEEPKNVKALYRRAQARQQQNDLEDAVKDYEAVLALEADNKAALAGLQECKLKLAKIHEREKKIFRGMFEKLSQEQEA